MDIAKRSSVGNIAVETFFNTTDGGGRLNHYDILGVRADATDQQIKEAYRREAMKWHPDRHDGAANKGNADRRFKDLAVAYRTLRDKSKRADYDSQLKQKLQQEYEARQREQARQRQAQPEPPKQDFTDSKRQHDEQASSSEDANQMFFEQMLDLAFELAGRGFTEANISKALVALGCPDALAKAVAVTASKRGGNTADKKSKDADEEGRKKQPSNSSKEHPRYAETFNNRNQTGSPPNPVSPSVESPVSTAKAKASEHTKPGLIWVLLSFAGFFFLFGHSASNKVIFAAIVVFPAWIIAELIGVPRKRALFVAVGVGALAAILRGDFN